MRVLGRSRWTNPKIPAVALTLEALSQLLFPFSDLNCSVTTILEILLPSRATDYPTYSVHATACVTRLSQFYPAWLRQSGGNICFSIGQLFFTMHNLAFYKMLHARLLWCQPNSYFISVYLQQVLPGVLFYSSPGSLTMSTHWQSCAGSNALWRCCGEWGRRGRKLIKLYEHRSL